MEASRFGFQMAPAFKFDPTDADLVAHYLLPRALGVPDPPFAHAIIDDDPAGLPPAGLFAKHGHGGSHHAFFLHTANTDAPESRERGVKGGAGGRWRGQKASVETVTLVHPGGGGELDIQYRRSELTYDRDAGKGEDAGAAADAAGWVMHEYQIVSPPLQATVLSRISKVRENQQPAAAATSAQN